MKKILNSKYKGVLKVRQGKKENWMAQYRTGDNKWEAHFNTEREAAIAYDKKMLEIGKDPVNILKHK